MKTRSALEGIKVASFCWIGAGPLAIKYFGMWGATVVRIESHTRPDLLRLMSPFKDGVVGVDNSAWGANINSSIYSVSLNLNKPRGREIALKLIQWADVVGENFAPGTMKKWDLDYESVRKVKSDIIYFSTSQLGQTGPHTGFIGFGYQAAALAGFTYISGWPDRGPIPFQGAYTDFTSARLGALAILAALDYKRRTGKGQFIDLSQMESCCHLLAPPIMDYFTTGRVMGRYGNRVDFAAPHGVYPCQGEDRWCAITVFTDEEWQAFCRALGEQRWIGDPRFATLTARKENEDELDELIAQWTKNHPAEEVEALMQAGGIAASAVESTKDLFEDPQIEHRGFFRQLKHSAIGFHTYRGPAFRLSKAPDCQFPGPALGEHNEWVLKDLLGLSDEEIAEGLIDGSITTDADLPTKLAGAM